MNAMMAPAELTEALALLTPVDAAGIEKVRLGNNSHGGYVVAQSFLNVHAAYSFGIGADVSFNLELAALGIPVHMFDHTVEKPGKTHELFTIHKLGLGSIDEPSGSWPTLEHYLRTCGDWGRTDLLLQLDAKRAEFAALMLCGPGILRHFRQIVLELHWLHRLGEPEFRADFVRVMTTVAAGFHIIHVHADNSAPIAIIDGLPVPSVLKLTLVRKDLASVTANATLYPTNLDFADDPLKPDHPLWYYPFLPSFSPADARICLSGMDAKRLRQVAEDPIEAALHPVLSAAPASMSPEAVVRALFILCLGREADPLGLSHFVDSLMAAPDGSIVLAAILQSVEYKQAVIAGRVAGVATNGHRIGPEPGVVTASLEDEANLKALAPTIAKLLITTPRIFGDPARVRVGQGVQLMNTLMNVSSGSINLGDYVFFGHNVCLLAATHDVNQVGLDRHLAIPLSGFDIVVGPGAWIATNATVLGPCQIGANAVVAAGSVVTGDVPAGCLVAGIPARVIKPIAAQHA